MKEAIHRGIPVFNIGGGPVPSRFTEKFGGSNVPYNSYRKNFIPFLETARNVYNSLDFRKSSWLQPVARMAQPGGRPPDR